MRPTVLATALATILAACGGDDGYSMTEPNQIAICPGAAATQAQFVGTWHLEWGCIGSSSPGGFVACDPAIFPFAGVDSLSIEPIGDPDKMHITIGTISGDGAFQTGDDGMGHIVNTLHIATTPNMDGSLVACDSDVWLFSVSVFTDGGSTVWGADATHL